MIREDEPAPTMESLLANLGPRRGHLAENVILFGSMLRRRGLDVTTGKILDACTSLGHIDLSRKGDFYLALRVNFVSEREQIDVFDEMFRQYWEPFHLGEEASGLEGLSDECGDEDSETPSFDQGDPSLEDWGSPEGEQGEDAETPGYSPEEVLAVKDFSTFTEEEVRAVRRIITRIAPKLATRLSRRYRRDGHGHDIDIRSTTRRSLRYGGDIVQLDWRRRKLKKLKLVLLCDVSGSMDLYSKFLIQFVYGLQQELKNVETFVFSTRLTRVTDFLRRKELRSALDNLARIVLDWSGGTSIGAALSDFNEGPGKSLVDHRTVVILISDGWDRGDPGVLEHEMQVLHRRANKLLWLNPLLGSPNYQPLCKGMQAALPHTDFFLPAHNLQSLIELSQTLEQLAAA